LKREKLAAKKGMDLDKKPLETSQLIEACFLLPALDLEPRRLLVRNKSAWDELRKETECSIELDGIENVFLFLS
jgi:hypothetical protein